jgi:RNA-directed DNA polymerase
MSGPKSFQISKYMVYEAYLRVKANKGAAGVDGQSVEQFEQDLKGNLYKLWNRMSSGCYFPPPVRMVEIPKPGGKGIRVLGVPSVADRIAQTVAAMALEPEVEKIFHPDSYGYRPRRSALDAVGVCRERCWVYDWVIDLDIKGFLNPWSHCSFVHCGGQNSPSWTAGGSIRRPFLRPVRTWTARSRLSLTRCMMVCRETP